jgi:nicotinamidase-related amidase
MASSETGAALLLAELQPRMVESVATLDPASLRHSAAIAAEIAEQIGMPVITSGVELAPGAPVALIDELARYQPHVRKTCGMLDDGAIMQAIREASRNVLAVGGVSSEIAILHTVLGARRQGFHVHVLVDCCGGLNARTEEAAFRQMADAGATLSSISSFFTGMAPAIDTGIGVPIFKGLARLWGWCGAR